MYVPKPGGAIVTGPALWRTIAGELRDEISNGRADVPTEAELIARYGTSRDTIRKALGALEHQGLITPGQGRRGRRLVERNPITLRVSAEETLTFIEDMIAGGHVVEPPEIDVKLEDDTLVREVLRVVDREPHNWAQWRFPLDVAERTRLAYRKDIEMGSIKYLKEGLGWTVMQETPYYDFRPPSPEEAMLLKAPGWVAVEHRAGEMTHPEVSEKRWFSAVRILRADRTRLVP